MKTGAALAPVSWQRMIRAVEKVRDRLLRAARALEHARVPYAVAGGNAVAAWVSRVDEAAVRNTRDVDILLRRADLEAARGALEAAGFVYRRVSSPGQPGGLDLFLDDPNASARDAVHVLFAQERIRPDTFAGRDRVGGWGTVSIGESEGAGPDEVDGVPGQGPHPPPRSARCWAHRCLLARSVRAGTSPKVATDIGHSRGLTAQLGRRFAAAGRHSDH